MGIFGTVFMVIAGLMFLMKLHVSYTSHGGSIGMVPVLDGAIFPPVFGTLGLWAWSVGARAPLPGGWLLFVGLWLVSTLLCGAAIVYAGRLGERRGA